MVVDHVLDVAEDLRIAPVGLLPHLVEARAIALEDTSRVGVQDKRDGKQALGPFCGCAGETRTTPARPATVGTAIPMN